mmetsp:Transcript_9186/g.27645  ORF Transcript_9186/g.27645 Transcript_9186/m.27645 type:complete len:878 (-) Transcript_9186:1288-3921(-)|eukprot:CAMPEP_0198733268 /NCGR_PEP_ID=MMETSP1475-20131203/44197_1 /TAXON_ID= ORGANISM="Unidentified sp., Strain CCMP1999" /NCGR_SAMPLE_ID=MMETSP1475 /ASSEMBLY_ACC=CAM_ASM_001111 /LENGTH=877 /DNA_ID=CAMNT_0044496543 /DNA_START=229 /DNA_END=2862 /DNA_ORIENTATION=+
MHALNAAPSSSIRRLVVFRQTPTLLKASLRRFSSSGRNGDDGEKSGGDDKTSLEKDIIPTGKGGLFKRKPQPKGGSFPAVPLFRRPLFPGVIAPIVVQEQSACEAFVKMQEAGIREAGLFLHKDVGKQSFALNDTEAISFHDAKQLHRVGVLGEMIRLTPRQKGMELTFLCHHRIRWKSVAAIHPLLVLRMDPVKEKATDIHAKNVRALSLATMDTLRKLLELGAFHKEQLELLLESVDINNPYQLADLGACLTTADPQKLQVVLEETDLELRLHATLSLLRSELETIKVQRKINRQIEETISKTQRRFFLMEQLKHVKKELGMEKDDKESLTSKFSSRMEKKKLPKEVEKVYREEHAKLSCLEPSSSEYTVTRNYVDWLTQIPWNVYSKDKLDIKRAETVLNQDHYGLEDVKERILEFIAVSSMRGNVQGKILLFSGPPGVGKTSIGKSVARALGRKFYRFSVGGMSDVAEIKGHRRTYVGALPGKCIQALKAVQTSNPVIMVDEIDKLGRGFHGDPASALLEVLDPEQNSSFLDHYIDLPVDMSKTLFLCTANVTDTIPPPLLDRMENIRLPGYILEEKVNIAQKYLYPTARKDCGLSGKNVTMTSSAIRSLAQNYCREAGVRNLKNHIEKVLRKVALKMKRGQQDKPLVITSKNLYEFVGKPKFLSERLYETTPLGVSTGLAWTSMGGAALYIESMRTDAKKPGFRTTGQMGEVMKESAEIAISYAKSELLRRDPENKFFETAFVHLHMPEGATPKDGPSAGVTMVTSILSLALNKSVAKDLAMTGELTLTGVILPVGGIREKVIAARRSGIKNVILPKMNEKDWDELPDFLKQDISVHFCETYRQVFDLAFPDFVSPREIQPSFSQPTAAARP